MKNIVKIIAKSKVNVVTSADKEKIYSTPINLLDGNDPETLIAYAAALKSHIDNTDPGKQHVSLTDISKWNTTSDEVRNINSSINLNLNEYAKITNVNASLNIIDSSLVDLSIKLADISTKRLVDLDASLIDLSVNKIPVIDASLNNIFNFKENFNVVLGKSLVMTDIEPTQDISTHIIYIIKNTDVSGNISYTPKISTDGSTLISFTNILNTLSNIETHLGIIDNSIAIIDNSLKA